MGDVLLPNLDLIIKSNLDYFTFYKKAPSGVSFYLNYKILKTEQTKYFIEQLMSNKKVADHLANILKDDTEYFTSLKIEDSIQGWKEGFESFIGFYLDLNDLGIDLMGEEIEEKEKEIPAKSNPLEFIIEFQKSKSELYLNRIQKLDRLFGITVLGNLVGAAGSIIYPKLSLVLFVSLGFSSLIRYLQKKLNDEKNLFQSLIQTFVSLKNNFSQDIETQSYILELFVESFLENRQLNEIRLTDIHLFGTQIEQFLNDKNMKEEILSFYEILNPLKSSIFKG